MRSVLVRQATASDIGSLQALFGEVDHLHCENQPDLFQKVTGPTREAVYLRGLMADLSTSLLVAEFDGTIVGCLILHIKKTPEIPILVPQRYAMVDTIVVAEAHRGTGIGRRLMEAAEHAARARGISRVELNVFEFNVAAQAFYGKLGYHTLSRRMAKCLNAE